jgi:hypothetical protein
VPFVAFLVLSLLAVRNDAPAVLVFLPGVAAGLVDLGGARVVGDRRSRVLAAAAGVLVVMVGLIAVAPLLTSSIGTDDEELVGGPHLNLSGYPVAAISWLDQEGLLTADTRLVARDYVGNYLESATGGEVPVFVDDRFDMYPDEVLEDHALLLSGKPGERGAPLELLQRYGADVVVWETATATGGVLTTSDRWAVVYEDDTWLVACPRDGLDGRARCEPGVG